MLPDVLLCHALDWLFLQFLLGLQALVQDLFLPQAQFWLQVLARAQALSLGVLGQPPCWHH